MRFASRGRQDAVKGTRRASVGSRAVKWAGGGPDGRTGPARRLPQAAPRRGAGRRRLSRRGMDAHCYPREAGCRQATPAGAEQPSPPPAVRRPAGCRRAFPPPERAPPENQRGPAEPGHTIFGEGGFAKGGSGGRLGGGDARGGRVGGRLGCGAVHLGNGPRVRERSERRTAVRDWRGRSTAGNSVRLPGLQGDRAERRADRGRDLQSLSGAEGCGGLIGGISSDSPRVGPGAWFSDVTPHSVGSCN